MVCAAIISPVALQRNPKDFIKPLTRRNSKTTSSRIKRQKHFSGTQQQLKIRSIVALFCISGCWNLKEEDAVIDWMLSRTLRLHLYL